MSEFESSPDHETSLENAARLLHKLTDIALAQSVWTPWQRFNPLDPSSAELSKPGYHDRIRTAEYQQPVDVTYRSAVRPKHYDMAWPGPTHVLDEAPGSIIRTLIIEERQVKQLAKEHWWSRNLEEISSSTYLTIKTANNETEVPTFDSPRELTEEEADALKPYGGGVHTIFHSRSDIPEIHYEVKMTPDGPKVSDEKNDGRIYSKTSKAFEAAGILADINQLLDKELRKD